MRRTNADRDALVELWTLQSCGCHACNAKLGEEAMGMTLCRDCGCKRCPKATNHLHACSQSNDSGQFGSCYGEECPDVCCTEYNAFVRQRQREWDELFPSGWRDSLGGVS
jgi:hypothetical protein